MLLFGALIFTSCTVEVRSGGESYYNPPPYYTMVAADNRYIFYNDGEPVAVWTFMDDGTVERSGVVINGPVKVFYEPGVVACVMNFNNNIRSGECTYYYSNGLVSEHGFYSGGIRLGDWDDYYENGRVYRHFSCMSNGSVTIGFQEQSGTRPEFFAGAGYTAMARDNYRMRPAVAQFNATSAAGYGAHASFGAVVGSKAPAQSAGAGGSAAVGFNANNQRQPAQTQAAPANSAVGMQAQGAVKAQNPAALSAASAAGSSVQPQPAQAQAAQQVKGKKGNRQGNNKKKGPNPPAKNFKPNKNPKPKKTPGALPK